MLWNSLIIIVITNVSPLDCKM